MPIMTGEPSGCIAVDAGHETVSWSQAQQLFGAQALWSWWRSELEARAEHPVADLVADYGRGPLPPEPPEEVDADLWEDYSDAECAVLQDLADNGPERVQIVVAKARCRHARDWRLRALRPVTASTLFGAIDELGAILLGWQLWQDLGGSADWTVENDNKDAVRTARWLRRTQPAFQDLPQVAWRKRGLLRIAHDLRLETLSIADRRALLEGRSAAAVPGWLEEDLPANLGELISAVDPIVRQGRGEPLSWRAARGIEGLEALLPGARRTADVGWQEEAFS